MITIPDALRRPAEIERDELRRRLAEIEEREAACCPEDVPFDEYIRALNRQLAEALAEIESKDKLIEQMAGALNHCKSTFEDYVKIHKAKTPVVTIGPIPPKWGDMQRKIARNQEAFDLCNAALSAAERGE